MIKMRIKLFLSFFMFGAFIFFITNLVFMDFPRNAFGTTFPLPAIFVISHVLIGGISYLLAITICRKWESLAAQAEEISRGRSLSQVSVGRAEVEIRLLTESFNRLKAELTQGEELRNRLVADVAHELRTPVAIVRGHLEMIVDGAGECKREQLVPLLDETKRISRLIQDLQDLNLAEAGRLTLDRSWVQFVPMVEEIISFLEVEAEAKSIALNIEGTGDGELYCDVTRIKQVLINLIGNAVRYTPKGGRIEVRYLYANGEVTVSVSDNGPGIAPEKLPYIFKRFYRAEHSRSRSSGGTGLGLAIAKQFAEVHGGTLEAFSKVGEGTTFTMTLPVYPQE